MKKYSNWLKVSAMSMLFSGPMHARVSLNSLFQVPVSVAPATDTPPANAPINLAGLLNKKSTPWRAKAMAILNNQELDRDYQESLFAIQFFFLQYSSKDLTSIASNQAVATPALSLASLLNAHTADSSQAGATNSISTVINLSALLGGPSNAPKAVVNKAAPVSLSSLFGKD